jgi:hypothetical protein
MSLNKFYSYRVIICFDCLFLSCQLSNIDIFWKITDCPPVTMVSPRIEANLGTSTNWTNPVLFPFQIKEPKWFDLILALICDFIQDRNYSRIILKCFHNPTIPKLLITPMSVSLHLAHQSLALGNFHIHLRSCDPLKLNVTRFYAFTVH